MVDDAVEFDQEFRVASAWHPLVEIRQDDTLAVVILRRPFAGLSLEMVHGAVSGGFEFKKSSEQFLLMGISLAFFAILSQANEKSFSSLICLKFCIL